MDLGLAGKHRFVTGSLALNRMNAAMPAKAAITSWSRALSIQVPADGITVNCVAPGRINSAQILNRLFPTEEIRRSEIELNVPAGVPRFSAGELRHRHNDPGRRWIAAARSEID